MTIKEALDLAVKVIEVAIEAVKTANDAIEKVALVESVLLAAAPHVHDVLRHIAVALGLGFKTGGAVFADQEARKGRSDAEIIVEIMHGLNAVLDAVDELKKPLTMDMIKRIAESRVETRHKVLQRLRQSVEDTVEVNRRVTFGQILAVIEAGDIGAVVA